MLADQFNETRIGLRYPDGYLHDQATEPLRRRLAGAQVLVMDREATAMAASVALSKPSSIVSALPWVRLPFERVWIEFSNAELRDAMAEMGSPNIRREGGTVVIERSGFLLGMEGDSLVLEYVHADRTPDKRIIDVCPVRGRFSLKEDITTPPEIRYPVEVHPEVRGRVRSYRNTIANDPEEMAAETELRMRFSWSSHPDLDRVRDNLLGMIGEAEVELMEMRQAGEMYHLFSLLVLPALILLNCRNAVTTEKVAVSPKLNKQRVAKGKPPLVEHLLVRMHLSPVARRRAEASEGGDGTRTSRGTLVIGHFKVRKTGVYWWSPHARRGLGAVRKTIVLTR